MADHGAPPSRHVRRRRRGGRLLARAPTAARRPVGGLGRHPDARARARRDAVSPHDPPCRAQRRRAAPCCPRRTRRPGRRPRRARGRRRSAAACAARDARDHAGGASGRVSIAALSPPSAPPSRTSRSSPAGPSADRPSGPRRRTRLRLPRPPPPPAAGLRLTPLGQEPMRSPSTKHPLARRNASSSPRCRRAIRRRAADWGTGSPSTAPSPPPAPSAASRSRSTTPRPRRLRPPRPRRRLPATLARPRTAGITLVPIRHHAPVFETYLAEPTTRRQTAAAAALLALAKHEA